MDVDESFKTETIPEVSVFKCYICTTDFGSKESFMKHKKQKHQDNIQSCTQFESGTCPRSEEECWYKHSSRAEPYPAENEQVFRNVPSAQFPPDQMLRMMEMMKSLCSKVDTMEKRLNEGAM